MIVKRKLFSSSKNKSDKDKKEEREKMKEAIIDSGLIGAGFTGANISENLADKISNEFHKKFANSKITAKDEKQIYEKLLKKAKDQGTIVDGTTEGSHYSQSDLRIEKARRNLAKEYKKARKAKKFNEARKLYDAAQQKLKKDLFEQAIWRNQDRIGLSSHDRGRPDILAHELGHSQYMNKKPGRTGDLLGKIASGRLHYDAKDIATNKGAFGKAANLFVFSNGVHAGYRNEKNRKEGKKISALARIRSTAVPALMVSPLLIAEGKASLKGLRMMKEMGASKQLLKESRRNLGHALGTYVGEASRPVFIGASGELIGTGVARIENYAAKNKDKNNIKNK